MFEIIMLFALLSAVTSQLLPGRSTTIKSPSNVSSKPRKSQSTLMRRAKGEARTGASKLSISKSHTRYHAQAA